MEREPNSEDRITKARWFSWSITEKSENNKKVNTNGKRSYKEKIWQEKVKSTEIEERRQYMAGSQEYLFKSTLK